MMRSLQHYAFEVPDLEVGRRFYTDFGLEGEEVGDTVVMRCAGRDQDQVVMREGPKKRLHGRNRGPALFTTGIWPTFDRIEDGLRSVACEIVVHVDDEKCRPLAEPPLHPIARGLKDLLVPFSQEFVPNTLNHNLPPAISI